MTSHQLPPTRRARRRSRSVFLPARLALRQRHTARQVQRRSERHPLLRHPTGGTPRAQQPSAWGLPPCPVPDSLRSVSRPSHSFFFFLLVSLSLSLSLSLSRSIAAPPTDRALFPPAAHGPLRSSPANGQRFDWVVTRRGAIATGRRDKAWVFDPYPDPRSSSMEPTLHCDKARERLRGALLGPACSPTASTTASATRSAAR